MNSPHLKNSSSWPRCLLVAGNLASVIVGGMILAREGNMAAFATRSVVNLGVAVIALMAALLIAWRKLWGSPGRLLGLVVLIAIGGMLLSLLYRDDYGGGSCGAFDWPAGHIHAGYPYSWLDGEICVAPGATIREYVAQHPEEAGWYPDPLAMFVDALFWGNVGILASALVGVVIALRKRKGLGLPQEAA